MNNNNNGLINLNTRRSCFNNVSSLNLKVRNQRPTALYSPCNKHPLLAGLNAELMTIGMCRTYIRDL